MHTYMYGFFDVHTWEGYEHYIFFSDDYSRFGYLYRKSNALDKFIEFKTELDNLLAKHMETLRLD